jgi:hypothetical protein
MADDLTRPFIGYRSAGRRPESQQDRRAAADAPLSALRGMVSGVLGAPGDIESLIRMLPGLSEKTVLPTSEDVEKRLPMRELNQTPTGKAFTTAGQLGGGFYTGPGSPLRAVAALPSAVSRAGRDFLMAGSPVNVVKPKGGNWLAGSVERAVEPMRAAPRPGQTTRQLAEMMPANEWIGLSDEAGQVSDYVRSLGGGKTEQLSAPDFAMNRWLETKLGKYIRNEMATPEDPLRALAERGVLHVDPQQLNFRQEMHGRYMEPGQTAIAQSPAAKSWEGASDLTVGQMPAGQLLQQGYAEQMPWLAKVPPETPVYMPSQSSMADDLGFGHLTDELRNAINPQSGLPRELMLKYSDLEKVTVPQAVERVAKINDWRAAQKAEADMARAMNPATQVVKEYPEQGFKWVELRAPEVDVKALGYTTEKVGDLYHAVDPQGNVVLNTRSSSAEEALNRAKPAPKELEDALKYEGETMGHCVGGYCPDVVEGRSKIYSLRDKKGQPHVTIEVSPGRIQDFTAKTPDPDNPSQTLRDRINAERSGNGDFESYGIGLLQRLGIEPPMDIVQIKGKGNKAPKEDYLPAVQDFVRSGNFGKVGDLGNTGLVKFGNEYRTPSEFLYRTDEGGWVNLQDAAKQYFPDSPAKQNNFITGAMADPQSIKPISKEEGFARGGAVRGYQSGGAARTLPELHQRYAQGGMVTGANSPTDSFDPARIDAIVAGLQAEMQS